MAAATQALSAAQQQLLRDTQAASQALKDSQQQLTATRQGVAGLRESLQAAKIGAALADVARTAQVQTELVGKSLTGQASAIASHFQQLSSGLQRLMQAGARSQTQQLQRQRKESAQYVADQQAALSTLSAAERRASGERQLQLRQEMALRQSEIAQQQTRMQSLEAMQRQQAVQQAKRQRGIALLGAVVDTSRAIMQALSNDTIPFSFRWPNAAAAAAMGALQLATIKAQPLPQFRHGGEVAPGLLRGPRHSKGGIPIEAEGGEWIFSREKTQQFRPLFEAIQTGKVQPQQLQGTPNSPARTPDLAPLADALRNLKQVHVNLDAKGFRVAEQTAQHKTTYLNSRYRG